MLSVFMVAFFTLSYSVAQEDLQELQSSLPSATEAGPGLTINSHSLASNTAGTAVDATTSSNTADPIKDKVTIGSFGDDRIASSNETDIIIDLLGADTVRGGGGDDKI